MDVLSSPLPFHNGYLLQARLGEGSLGVVYLALTRTPDPVHVAIKRIKPQAAQQVDHWAEIRREANAAMAASGPYIAQLQSFEASGQDPYLVTDYVPSVSLREALASGYRLPPDTVRLLGAALSTALVRLHSKHVVHRDLKPGNVLLALDGPRIIDFGVARLAAATQRNPAGEVPAGTPGYMSPEQYDRYDVGPACDTFALGVVLAQALTGRAPFGAADWREHRRRAYSREYDLRGLPPFWHRLVTGCLDPEPRSRSTAEHVRRELSAGDLDGAFARQWLPTAVHHTVLRRTELAARLLHRSAGPGPALPDPGTLRLPPVTEAAPAAHGRSKVPQAVAAIGLAVAAAGGLSWWAAGRAEPSDTVITGGASPSASSARR